MTSVEIPELEPKPLFELRNLSHYRRYEKNQSVFREGDRYRGPFIVSEGTFKVFIFGDIGKESILHIFNTGDLVAGGPLFLGGNYPASCLAMTDGCLVEFDFNGLKALMENDDEIYHYFACKSMELMPHLKEKIFAVTLKSAELRIIDYLKSIGAERKSVKLGIPKNQLAALLDLTPESVSRMFNQLTRKGRLVVEDELYRLQ